MGAGAMQANYPECYKAVRKFEGGNDDDPQDPGGRTSRGIIQREWNKYRETHPGRPADVWQASEADVAAIYKQDYWDAQSCDALPSGVDETIFDYGVNSGIGRAPKVLRRCLHMPDNAPYRDVLGKVASLSTTQTSTLINAINDERLQFLKNLKTWPRFGGGWSRRVLQVREISLRLQQFPVGGATAPAPVPVREAPGKGKVPEPTGAKNATKTAGTAAAGGTLFMWVQTHPYLTGLAVVGILCAIGYAVKRINDNHKAKQEAPPKGWLPPASLKRIAV